jgi:hypothetical protein
MIIVTDKYRLRIGWRFILRWPGIVRAAVGHYVHGAIYIGPIRITSW